MVQSGVCKQIVFIGPRRERNPQLTSHIKEEEYENDEGDGEAVTAESLVTNTLVTNKRQKRKRRSFGQVQKVEAVRYEKKRESSGYKNSKQMEEQLYGGRWSSQRYKHAEQSLLEIMKAKGAVFGNPILRPALRLAARNHIGDTGLLDHLLKHMDGQVAPGGTERFRRWYNTNGVMEYWLESADLVNIRHEARVEDPFWIPPPEWKPGGSPSQDPIFSRELKLLKEEMAKMKRDLQGFVSKRQEEDHANVTPNFSVTKQKLNLESSLLPLQEVHKELVKWKAKTQKQLMEISSSLNGIQDTYKGLEKWKAKIEQQLLETSNSLSSMQVSKQDSPSVSESWKDWLGSTDLVNTQQEELAPTWLESCDLVDIQQEDLASWLESSDLVNIEPEATVQDPCWVPAPGWKPGDSPSEDPVRFEELELLKEEMAKMKRDVQELVPKKEEDEANVTPSCSAASNSKLDLDNSVFLLQEMHKELVNWKAKIEKQLMEISNSLASMQASKQGTTFSPTSERWK
ncbi:hypothetical protein L1049_019874 [Liquidambar formosana]|uniref:PTC1-like winged helix-turn-helix domain-containing protein n=1 Tax=Liquidambar formosana TaxID=63359 RepID=A0AAP0X6V4_LIQFO